MWGIYRVSDGRFLRRLWKTQPVPQAEIDAGEIVVREVPPWLLDVGAPSLTRWNGVFRMVEADTARMKVTPTRSEPARRPGLFRRFKKMIGIE